MKKILLFFPLLLFILSLTQAQQCTINYVNDFTPPPIQSYLVAQGWSLWNSTSSCNAVDYYITPQSAQISYNGGSTWQPYSGMNLEFRRTAGPNMGNLLQSDRFTINAGNTENLSVWFNVSPNDSEVHYRVYFDIYDANNNVLPPLSGGRIYAEFYYPPPKADLIVTNEYVVPQSAGPGESVTVYYTIKNVGFVAAPPSHTKIYYSGNTSWSAIFDDELDDVITSGLQPGEMISYSTTVTLPLDAVDGDRYLFVYADALEQIDEVEEDAANRERIDILVSGVPTNDITIENVQLSATQLLYGDVLTIDYVHTYSGNQLDLGLIDSHVYWSEDCTIDAGDELIGDHAANIDRDTPESAESTNETINTDIDPGIYYVIISGDHDNEVSEVDEANTVCIQVEVLDAVNYYTNNETITNTTILAGGTTYITCRIQNPNSGTDRVYIGYYLSTNPTFEPSVDVYLGQDNHNFAVSSINSENATLTIPVDTQAGTYYILIVTDYEFEILESDETDNIHAFPITVTNNCTPPVANFFQSSTEIEAGEGVYFNDTSTDADYWSWTFDGGNPSSYDDRYPPTVVFNTPGDHTISLTVSNACGSDTKTSTLRVLPDPTQAPTAYYSSGNPSYGGDPIDLSTGAYVYAVEDMSLAGINGQYAWRRFYNSDIGYSGPLGNNWTHSYDIGIEVSGNQWTVRHGNGQRTYFTGYSDGLAYPNYAGTLTSLSKDIATGTYTFTKPNGTVYTFDSDGCIQSITNRKGNQIIFTSVNCELTRVTFPGGRYIDITNSGGLITQVADNTGRTVLYGYNNGDLTSSTDVRGNITIYSYDAMHRMLSMIDARGNTVVTNTYDAIGRVVSQLDALNNQTTITYDTPSSGATTVTNALSGTQVHYHNSKYRLTRFTNELGQDIYLGYDTPTGKIDSYQNERGYSTFYDLDANGNLVLVQDALANQTMITVNSLNLPTHITNALGHTTQLGYDGVGNPTTLTLPNGAVYTTTFDAQGQAVTKTTPNGNTTTYVRNSFGDLTSIQTPTGNYTIVTDNLGRVTSITDRNGNTTTVIYDAAGNVTRMTDALGFFVEMTYDANGSILTNRDKEGHITTFLYNQRNELTQITDPLGYTHTFQYDALGRMISVTDANGNVVSMGYDAKGQLLTLTNAFGTFTMTYDEAGNITHLTDAEGNTYVTAFDAKNRPIRFTDPLGNETNLSYDALDRLLDFTDANGHTTAYGYTSMNWLATITDPLGGIVQYNQDLEGNIIEVIDANGNSTTATYDLQNRNTEMTYPGGYTKSNTFDNEGFLATSTDENGIIATYQRNSIYHLTGVNYSNGAQYTFTHDAIGRMLTMGNGAGTMSLTRDARGLITAATDQFGNSLAFGYDGNGNRTSITYPGSQTVTTTYNALNLPIRTEDWLGNYAENTYNANGSLTGIANSNGTSTTITRDALNRVASYANFQPDMSVINSHVLTYDPVGNITDIDEDVLLKPNFLPTMDQMLYAADDRQTTRAGDPTTFDDRGAMTSLSATTGSSFTWGQDDLLTAYTHDGSTVTNMYDPFGDRLQKTKDGVTTNFLLDPTGSLSQILQEQATDGSVLNTYIHTPGGLGWKLDEANNAQFYHFDYLGHTRALSDGTGTLTDAYATDAFGDYLAHVGNSEQPFIFLGRYGIEYEGSGLYRIRRRFLDAPQGRFISKDMAPMGAGTQGTNEYVYGLNNPYRWMDVDGFQAVGAGAVATITEFDLPYGGTTNAPNQSFDTESLYTYDTEAYLAQTLQWVHEANQTNNYTSTNPNSCTSYTVYFNETSMFNEPVFADIQSGRIGISFYSSWLDYNGDGQLSGWELALGITEGLAIAIDIATIPSGEAVAYHIALKQGVRSSSKGLGKAILKNGFYEVNGLKFSKYYYEKLWRTGRKSPSLIAKEVIEGASAAIPDSTKKGFYKYIYDGWEVVFNPKTKEVWHLQPIK